MEDKKFSELFIGLVSSFQMQVMMHLGKLKNPVTDKTEKDLDAARMMIDMIEMLKDKTKNNLSNDETKFIDTVLSNLQLNFVEESGKSTDSTASDSTTENTETKNN